MCTNACLGFFVLKILLGWITFVNPIFPVLAGKPLLFITLNESFYQSTTE